MSLATPSRSWVLLIAMLCLAMLLQWNWIAIPGSVATAARAPEGWELPTIALAQPERAIEILSKTNPWGSMQAPGATAAAIVPVWRLVGIVRVGPERVAVIQADQQPERQLKPGDALPGGGKILKIDEDALIVLDNGEKRTVGIYQQGSKSL